MKRYTVATYYEPSKKRAEPKLCDISTYTVWYSPEWAGYRAYEVEAESGAEAKREAAMLRLHYERAIQIGTDSAPSAGGGKEGGQDAL